MLVGCYTDLLFVELRSFFVACPGYYRPPFTDADAVVMDVISDLLSGSRSARLYKVGPRLCPSFFSLLRLDACVHSSNSHTPRVLPCTVCLECCRCLDPSTCVWT